jgi:hypothetical protein
MHERKTARTEYVHAKDRGALTVMWRMWLHIAPAWHRSQIGKKKKKEREKADPAVPSLSATHTWFMSTLGP